MINSFRDGPTIDWSKLRKKNPFDLHCKGKVRSKQRNLGDGTAGWSLFHDLPILYRKAIGHHQLQTPPWRYSEGDVVRYERTMKRATPTTKSNHEKNRKKLVAKV
jgi:hypothetical protein